MNKRPRFKPGDLVKWTEYGLGTQYGRVTGIDCDQVEQDQANQLAKVCGYRNYWYHVVADNDQEKRFVSELSLARYDLLEELAKESA